MNIIKNISLALLLIPMWFPALAQGNCQPDVVVTAPLSNTSTVQSSNTITGSSLITSSANITFDAGNEVILLPGFHAVLNSEFLATIGGCTPGPLTAPNDPYFLWQWGHQNLGQVPIYDSLLGINQRSLGGTIDADADILEAWEVTKGSSNITVALLDFGIDLAHEDFNFNRVVYAYNFVDENHNYQDNTGHGTNVAGILAATPNNNKGTAGVDWNCSLMPLKISSALSFGGPSRIRRAVDSARVHGANIISMSFGSAGRMGPEVEVAFREAIDANLLLFAASGNDNRASLDYPARYASIVGVGAMSPCNERKSSVTENKTGSCDQDDRPDGTAIADWGSNFGSGLDFLAPGTLLPTTDVTGLGNGVSNFPNLYQSDPTGDYVFDSWGTSMSSPFAAGIASLVWSVNPNLKNYQVLHIMRQSVTLTNGSGGGLGNLNAKNAVDMATTFDPNSFKLPNLSLELISPPGTVGLNTTLSIPFRVVNIGDAVAGSSTLSYEISSAIPASSVSIPSLNPQASFSGTIDIPITSNDACFGGSFQDGTFYTVDFTVDGQNQVTEFNEFNDFSYKFQALDSSGLTDLVIENASVEELKSGEVEVSYELKNIGESRLNIFVNGTNLFPPKEMVRYYHSTDNTLDNTDTQIGSYVYTISVDICPQASDLLLDSVPANNGFLLIHADGAGSIAESDEGNNVLALAFPGGSSFSRKTANMNQLPDLQQSIRIIPNPILEGGEIAYSLESTQLVSIMIYDLMGSKMQSILPTVRQVAGSYKIPFHKAGLAAGVYLLEVRMGGKRFTEKLLVQ